MVSSPEIVSGKGHDELLLAPVGTKTTTASYKLSFKVDSE